MVQIEKRKKKGRPSKADLAARRAAGETTAVSPSSAAEVRRSLRRKTFRYNIIDYDEDYLEDDVVSEEADDDEDEEDDEEDDSRRRRGKKVKLVVKLNSTSNNNNNSNSSSRRRTSRSGSVSRRGRVGGDSEEEDDEYDDDDEEDEDEEDERAVKKRRIYSNGCGERDDEDEDDEGDNGENGGNEEEEEEDVVEGRDGKDEDEAKEEDENVSEDGYRSRNRDGNTPLPDKKQLELILDKLQKKDTYGVYSEPVDPEELPDYHDVIEHPMDFSTVRKKLANGAYSTLEQFETDVFLISSNAMQYNSPETVYHKQARAIKELAEKKFERVRMHIARLEKEAKSETTCEPKVEPKSEQKERPYPLVKKQTKKPFSRGTQEPVGSDFSTAPTVAVMDTPNICTADHVGNFERPVNSDGPLEGPSSIADSILEKADDPQLGKGILPKFGRRTIVVDENRRATYNISNEPEETPESVFTTFDGEKKQLISVGLSGELSYARSLARFASNLGPMAWKTASRRIEQVLPPDFKYGRGWIGEYEPLPMPVLVFEHPKDPFTSRLCNNVDSRKEDRKDLGVSRSHGAISSRKDEKPLESLAQANVHQFNQSNSDGKMAPIVGCGGPKPPTPISVSHQQNPPSKGFEDRMFKGVESNSPSMITHQNNAIFQQQNRFSRDTGCHENIGAKTMELNSPSISDQKRDCFPQKQFPHGMEMGQIKVETYSLATSDKKTENVIKKPPPRHVEIPTSMPSESLPKGKNFLLSPPFKQPNANGGAHEGLSNGKVVNNFVGSNQVITSSQGFLSPHLAGAPVSFPLRQDQGLSDPVLVMKMMTEKAHSQKQQNGSIHAHTTLQARPSVPSPRGDIGGNAAQAAASAWMSVGSSGQNSSSRSQISADSLHNATTRMFYPQAMQSHVEYPGVSATMHLKPEKMGLPFQSFPQPTKIGNESQVLSRPMVYPQQVPNDLSRFQVQAPWRGHSPHTQQKQKPDTLPPDLNVAFQSTVDSQQPDLALQL